MLELDDLKKMHDKAYVSGQVTRERAADDLVFYFITQWDDNILAESQLAYRGEFNIIRKAGRQTMADLQENDVQVDFVPIDEAMDDAADLLDGMFRSDANNNMSQESFFNAQQEAVVCGIGAWQLYTDYVSNRSGDTNQVIKRRPIFEANNTVFFDPNAKLLDKSDAKFVSVLTAYSEDGYRDLVEELTGEELSGATMDSFKHPEQSYTFPWIGGEGRKIYVVEFYHRKKVKDKIITLVDPFGQTRQVRDKDMINVMDDLLDAGYSIESDKKVERWEVTKYIASGSQILSSDVIAGQHIPVVPQFGEHAYVEGEEHYEGITRLAKDPQRLRNFQMSYLADIVSRSPRTKPIFLQEQIAGLEDFYSESGPENNFPYVIQNRMSGDGTELPLGPVGVMPEQPMPQSLIASINLSREAVEDVANPGIPQDVANVDLSGKAVMALQARIDMQSMVYQENMKHAKRRDGEVYASMASEVYDTQRHVKMLQRDGTRSTGQTMEMIIDKETGDIVTINDLSSAEFDVYSKIGPSYRSQKEQTVERLGVMFQGLPPGDPMRNALMLKTLVLMDGVDFDDIREYANKQLILTGIKEAETDEEKEMVAAQQQQGQQPSAEMVLALAEDKKGQAALMKEQRSGVELNLKYGNEDKKRLIDEFNAATKRLNLQLDAQEANAKLNMQRVDTLNKRFDKAATG